MTKSDGEIRLGTINYVKYFPNSENARKFASVVPKPRGMTFVEYANTRYHIVCVICYFSAR
jgi:hypothetical protein